MAFFLKSRVIRWPKVRKQADQSERHEEVFTYPLIAMVCTQMFASIWWPKVLITRYTYTSFILLRRYVVHFMKIQLINSTIKVVRNYHPKKYIQNTALQTIWTWRDDSLLSIHNHWCDDVWSTEGQVWYRTVLTEANNVPWSIGYFVSIVVPLTKEASAGYNKLYWHGHLSYSSSYTSIYSKFIHHTKHLTSLIMIKMQLFLQYSDQFGTGYIGR